MQRRKLQCKLTAADLLQQAQFAAVRINSERGDSGDIRIRDVGELLAASALQQTRANSVTE